MKNAVILVEDIYEDLEFWYPYYRLKEAGFSVHSAAPEKGRTYTSKHGFPAVSELSVREINPQEVDILVVPGGYAPDKLRRYKEVLDLVRKSAEKGAVTATICHGAWVFISAGITKGRKMTCVSAIKDDLVNAGAEYVDEPAVTDGRMVTARTPADLPEFMKEIIRIV